MTMTVTSAASRRLLLTEIKNFATGVGWTAAYDQITAKGQLGLSKGTCYVALGELRDSSDATSPNTTRTDVILGSSVDDYLLHATLNSAFLGGNTKYWGHTGGPPNQNSSVSAGNHAINDMTGPFNTVWLFTDASGNYIHVIVLSAPSRYTHFSFGFVDKLGMTHADIPYLTGQFYTWWASTATLTNSSFGPNQIEGNSNSLHTHPYRRPQTALVGGSVHDVAFGFANGVLQEAKWSFGFDVFNTKARSYQTSSISGQEGSMSDPAVYVLGDQTTGGLPLWPLPVIQINDANDNICYVGDFPGVRLCNMDGRIAGEQVTLGADDWRLFPIKQIGSDVNTLSGVSPTSAVNTHAYGLAFLE